MAVPGPLNPEPESMDLNLSNHEELVPRKIPPQNIVQRLVSREIYGRRRHPKSMNNSTGFYTNIYPNYSVENVDLPLCFLRKFTPDGKR